MTVDLKHLTYQQYLDLPEMRARYSIVDGELVMAAAPTTEHQRTILELAVKLTPFVREHQIGQVWIAHLDVVIRRDPLRTRQPDLMYISNARRYILGPQVVEGGPDLNRSTEDWYTHAATCVCSSEAIFSTAAVTAGS
jgi:Uma2 family endonuclease